jgi:two-component system nitrate/nitrite response regulator NarL
MITASNKQKSATAEAAEGKTVRVLLADDHPVVRKGLTSFLGKRTSLEILGEVSDGRETLRMARESRPDVILLDIDMPIVNGLAVAEILQKEQPGCKVLMYSTFTSPDFVQRILRSGARGYVLKDSSPEELLQAIETVAAGQTYFSPEISRIVLNHMLSRHANQDSPLTDREREVLVHIAEGLSNKEIACRLNIGTRTVETHRDHLMRKLNIHSIAGLTRYALRAGLVPMPELSMN